MGYDLKMRVWRGDAEGGELTDYTVEVSEGEVVLDALHRLQATQTGDLAIRWNCKAGKCGSCSAEINGRPRLLCMTRLSDFEPTDTITAAEDTVVQALDRDDFLRAVSGHGEARLMAENIATRRLAM